MKRILLALRRPSRGPVLVDSDTLARWLAYVAAKGVTRAKS
jgi:hypothetical protein